MLIMCFYFRSLFVVNFFISLGFAMVDPFFPIYVKNMGASGLHFAAIFSVFTIAKLILNPWIGFCSDRVGRSSFIAIGLGLYVCVSLLYLFPPSVALLIVARFLQGFAAPFLGNLIMEFKGLPVVFYGAGIIGIIGVIIFYICSTAHES